MHEDDSKRSRPRHPNVFISYFFFYCKVSLDNDIYHSLHVVHCRGCLWKSADGQTRKCYPVVAAFQVDYPESQLLTLTRQNNACPTCMASKSDFGDLATKHEMRTPELASHLHQQARDLERSGSIKDADDFLQKYGQVYLEVCGNLNRHSGSRTQVNS